LLDSLLQESTYVKNGPKEMIIYAQERKVIARVEEC